MKQVQVPKGEMKLDTNRLRAALAKEKTAIHCDTLEKAEALFEAMGWKQKESIAHCWKEYGDKACFLGRGTHGYWSCFPLSFYLSKGFSVTPLAAFILPDEPHICGILGVRVNQVFKVNLPGFATGLYRINADGYRECKKDDTWHAADFEQDLALIINNPHLIHIIPRWSEADIEDAKAVRRLFPDMVWVAREENGRLWLYKAKPTRMGGCFVEGEFVRSMDTPLFESVTWNNSPVKLENIK